MDNKMFSMILIIVVFFDIIISIYLDCTYAAVCWSVVLAMFLYIEEM